MSDASIGAKPHYLVGDIGGTNARFAYVTPEQAQPSRSPNTVWPTFRTLMKS